MRRRGPAGSAALKAVLLAAVALAAVLPPPPAVAAAGAADSDAGAAAETPQDAGGGAAAALTGDSAVIPEAGDSMATLKTADTTYQVLAQARLDATPMLFAERWVLSHRSIRMQRLFALSFDIGHGCLKMLGKVQGHMVTPTQLRHTQPCRQCPLPSF